MPLLPAGGVGEHPVEVVDRALSGREVELLLRAEEPEEIGLRDAGGAGDVVRRGSVEPATGELDLRRIEDCLASLLRGLSLRRRRHSSKYSLTRGNCQALRAGTSREAGERPGHPVALVLGHRRRKRQRESPGERAIGAGERPLVAIGAEVMERVRPDLRLDPLGPECGERLVTTVELDDVRLPPVPVARGRRRRQHDLPEALRVPPGHPLARRQELLEARELGDADRTEDVRDAVVEPGLGNVVGTRS